MNKVLSLVSVVLLLLSTALNAGQGTVFEYSVEQPLSKMYPAMQASFEDSRFFIVDELNIGKNLSNFSEKWGEDYNRNRLTGFRSIIFCNGWYANMVSNQDTRMLGLCPLHMTLIEKDGKTTALFNRPTAIAKGSPAYDFLEKIEQEVIEIIRQGMK